jgi:hypothetical protein
LPFPSVSTFSQSLSAFVQVVFVLVRSWEKSGEDDDDGGGA